MATTKQEQQHGPQQPQQEHYQHQRRQHRQHLLTVRSTATTTTTSSTANSIPKHIDTAQHPQSSVASEVLAKRIVELESDLYCARSALMVQQPYQQQYPQPYYSQPCYHQQQPYYYDPNYGWVATASPVDDGEVYPYNPAA